MQYCEYCKSIWVDMPPLPANRMLNLTRHIDKVRKA